MTPNELLAFEDRLRTQAAERLAACAVMLQTEEMSNLSVANPHPHLNSSKPGEYPRARTFNLRNSIAFQPSHLNDIKRTLRIAVGYAAGAFYGPILVAKGWLGLLDTLDTIRPRVAQMLAGFGSARKV